MTTGMPIHNNTLSLAQGEAANSRRIKMLVGVALALIVLLGAFLRFYELGADSVGNSYYAATVQSMLLSWKNFFFAAYEPGGSVTVDKPPLGFWVQAVSASIFGINGFALALPQALAGVGSILVSFWLVRRHFGAAPGLLAALALAVTPVAVSTERNNTIDGLLVFVLLLAAWAFLAAVERGKARYLFLGAFLVGVGFNIKMLQAYMILPALYAVYFLGARQRWWKRLAHLAAATVVLVTVSLSWAVIVDLTPASERPYIGSSTNNTVMELITGHNGLKRLLGGQMAANPQGASTGDGAQNLPPAGMAQGAPRPAGDGMFPGGPMAAGGGMGGTDGPQMPRSQAGNAPGQPGGRSDEVGQAGWLRLFTEPLASEAAWLLPLALLGIPLALVLVGWRWPLNAQQLGVILWASWLLPCALYFSLTSGLFHTYYLIMLGPPIAALAGAALWGLWQVFQQRRRLGWAMALILGLATLAAQAVPLFAHAEYGVSVFMLAGVIFLAGLGMLAWAGRPWLGKLALGLVILSMTIAPLAWAGLTALNPSPDVALPRSGPGDGQPNRPAGSVQLSNTRQKLVDYLLANTDPDDYLLATLSSHQASSIILATLRPVLTFGGFNGGDNVIDVAGLAQMVESGKLRFILGGQELERSKPEIANWVKQTCRQVTIPGLTIGNNSQQPQRPGVGQTSSRPGAPGDQFGSEVLYDCAIY